MRLAALAALVAATFILFLLVAPTRNADPFYRGERERISVEYAQLGLEEARWSSQVRQMAWQQQLTQPQIVYVEQTAPAASSVAPGLWLILGLWTVAAAFGCGLGVALLWQRPVRIEKYTGDTVYIGNRERVR